jgi:hypothetical protein
MFWIDEPGGLPLVNNQSAVGRLSLSPVAATFLTPVPRGRRAFSSVLSARWPFKRSAVLVAVAGPLFLLLSKIDRTGLRLTRSVRRIDAC